MNLTKLFLIIKREYLTRLKSKTFIISTILAPIFILAMFLVPILMTNFGGSSNEQVIIVDHAGGVANHLVKLNPNRYINEKYASVDTLRSEVIHGQISGFIVITPKVVNGSEKPELVYSGNGGITFTQSVRSDLQTAIRDALLSKTNVNPDVKSIMERSIHLQTKKLTKSGEEKQNTDMLFVVGYFMAIGIYMAMFIYGSLIMRGVIEEKTSRIIEIMASSAKPFELLLGKVLGVGALGATQFLIWVVSISGITTFGAPFIVHALGGKSTSAVQSANSANMALQMPHIGAGLWIFFILFFVLGYLMYSALFAAVGSAADSETDVQQLTFPITIPIILPIMFLTSVTANPGSTFAVVTSMIPLFSPILMIARMAVSSVPLWQSLGSVVLMILTFLGLMWLSSRVYRVGILMYGKKPSFKEIAKWIRYN
ncbi:MAG TPA: ABC transporter permease [Balneolales bacterium]|nr:ABC transporter permease [Balneolales bacterium]